jgi:dTDP-4-amino-4,6-dideoxygalactose transaminase
VQSERPSEPLLERLSVPFVDLGPSHASLMSRVLSRIGATIERGDFINGADVTEFEGAFADWTGRAHCVGLASGLDALRLALLATGLQGDQGVAVPAATFAATFEAVLQAGGTPVVVDVDERDYGLDVRQVETVADRVSHVVPVHLYGQLADMRALAAVAEPRGLTVVEDACQAHGAARDGLRPGDAGAVAAFSFYPSKNLGAFGDAGAAVTDDGDVAALMRALRVHGETRKYHHEHVGYTARLDTIQAGILAEKLPLLEEWNADRQRAAAFYSKALAELDGLRLPPAPPGSDPVWHLYVVRSDEPQRLATFLGERGIQTGRHYPEPVHLSPAYRSLGYAAGDFPVAESLAREGLSLPLYPGISERQLEHVCTSLAEYFGAA